MEMEVFQGNIVTLKVDAIVNAANRSLLGGGGVDGAIHRAAGPKLLEECRSFGGCETGEAVITNAYELPCRYVIHTPGPVWEGGANGEPESLRSCYLNSLRLAAERKLNTVAFPSISTGVYGYPIEKAAAIAVDAVSEWTESHPVKVIFVAFSSGDFATYEKILDKH